MNPYAAPGTASTRMEDDIAEAVPALMARVAGGVLALAGGVVALTGVQTMMAVTIRGPVAVVPYVLIGLGLPHLVLGIMVFRARVWAAVAGIAGTSLLTLASAFWLVFGIGHGFFSLYALGAPFVSMAAFVLVLLGLGPCQRSSAARSRLRAQGMDLGI